MANREINAGAVSNRPVPIWRQVNYGAGMFGPTALNVYQLTFLILFYSQVVGLRAELAGVALWAGRLWDAVTDPIMGNISDRTTARMGRRRPYMLLGAVPLAVSYIALWTPPLGWSQQALFIYLLVAYIAYNTFITVVMVPYVSLGGELSMDYHERTRIMAVRMVFQNLGWFMGAVGVKLNQVLLDNAAAEAGGGWKTALAFREGYAGCSVVFGAVTVLTLVWSAAWVKEDPKLRAQHHTTYWHALARTLKNKSFLLLIVAFLGASLFEAIGFAIFPFVVGLWYYSGDMVKMNNRLLFLMFPILITAIVALPFWTMLSRFFGKKHTFLVGLAATTVITILNFYMITPHAPLLIWPWLILFGFAVAAPNLLTPAIVPDIVDEEELATGARREGSFFGMLTFTQKFAGAFGAGLVGVVLGLIGFEEGAAQQSDATITWIRALYAFLRGGGYIVTFVIMLWFPLTVERVAAIRRQLDQPGAQFKFQEEK